VARTVERYPGEPELMRLLRAHSPHLFFLDVSRLEDALATAAVLASHAPAAQVLAFARDCDERTLLELMRSGLREFILVPGGFPDLPEALDRVEVALERAPAVVPETDELIAFLPAKPGVGCSTIALNTSVTLAAQSGRRVLLIDLDLNCGIVGFLLHLNGAHSVVDAAEHAAQLDEELWGKLVVSAGNLDILPAGPMRPGFRMEPAAMRYLLDFARRNYDFVCADLSGLMERFSVELMEEAKRIYLVVTPELPSLHLARQKLEYLRGLEMDRRVSLLLNRAQKRGLISSEEVQKAVGVPVAVEIPNDYRGVHKALSDAKPVQPNSELGRCYASLARRIASNDAPAAPQSRFVEYFSLVPARFSVK
jgi:pilus assembly protein CpaE